MNHTRHALVLLVSLVAFTCGSNDHVYEKDTSQKRMVFKKGDHLFNNIAKALTDMTRDVFSETDIRSVTKADAYSAQNVFLVMDVTENNKDVSDQFLKIISNYLEYKNDKLLTTTRDSLSIYGQTHTGPDQNALQWSKTIEELRKMIFGLINEVIKATWLEKDNLEQQKNLLKGLFQNIDNRISEIVDGKEYVDQYAKKVFMDNEKKKSNNNNDIHLVEAVEERIEEVLKCLPNRIKFWSVEAANFFKKKLNRKG